jgi:hypothetical protein
MGLTLDDTHKALATLRVSKKGRSARLPNSWLLCLCRNYRRDRWEIELHVGGVYRWTWSAKPEYLEVKRGTCRYGSNDSWTIKPDILDAMAAKLFARLKAIEADYLPQFRLFRSWPAERVRYRVLSDYDAVDVSGWQVLMDRTWYVLSTLVEREDIPALVARCEALGRDRFMARNEDRGLSVSEIAELEATRARASSSCSSSAPPGRAMSPTASARAAANTRTRQPR